MTSSECVEEGRLTLAAFSFGDYGRLRPLTADNANFVFFRVFSVLRGSRTVDAGASYSKQIKRTTKHTKHAEKHEKRIATSHANPRHE